MPVLKSFLRRETRLQNFSLRRATPTAEAAAQTFRCASVVTKIKINHKDIKTLSKIIY
ncbi:MAG: hypothetical protein KME40_28360 [Komarekiella atlantica HA4396-MV6]|nr:hypothetical protein [Komarekiella atlantica HA4396-MV6]